MKEEERFQIVGIFYGMTDDFARIYGNVDTKVLARAGVKCFRKLLEIQEERAKKRGIRGLLSKLTGAFVLGAEQEQEKSQENVQENIEERNDEDERE